MGRNGLVLRCEKAVARMEPTGRREAPPDDRLREIRDSRDAGPGLRFAPFYQYKCTRGRGCNGHPAFPTPSLGGRFIKASGAQRRGIANVCLESRCRHSSCPGLTRASINLRKTIFEEDGLPGRARQ